MDIVHAMETDREEDFPETRDLAAVEDAAPVRGPDYTGWVVFTISGEQVNPEHMSLLLGMQPDRSAQGLAGRPGFWQINSSLEAQASIDDHLRELIRRLLPVRKKMRMIARDAELQFYCAIEKRKDGVAQFRLPSQLLLLIGYLGATVVCDVSDPEAL